MITPLLQLAAFSFGAQRKAVGIACEQGKPDSSSSYFTMKARVPSVSSHASFVQSACTIEGFMRNVRQPWTRSRSITRMIPKADAVHTVDGRNPAPPKKPWNDDSPVNTHKHWFFVVSKWCRISSIHSISSRSPLQPTGQTMLTQTDGGCGFIFGAQEKMWQSQTQDVPDVFSGMGCWRYGGFSATSIRFSGSIALVSVV